MNKDFQNRRRSQANERIYRVCLCVIHHLTEAKRPTEHDHTAHAEGVGVRAHEHHSSRLIRPGRTSAGCRESSLWKASALFSFDCENLGAQLFQPPVELVAAICLDFPHSDAQ